MLKILLCWIAVALCANDNFCSIVKTVHELSLDGKILPYTAVTGKFPMDSPSGDEDPPEIFFIAYFKEHEHHRPITFVFPGGPGSSCGPQAISSFGPHRILTPAEGKTLLPPYRIIDNPETILLWTDLVFIDPLGTGLSTTQHNSEAVAKFFNVEADIRSLSDFIRTFIAYFNRWNSPKYLAGCSYGTTRCCGLAEDLTRHDFSISGLILLGSAVDYSTLLDQHNRTLPSALLIPTFAATAWYHGLLWPDKSLEEVVAYAREFMYTAYIPHLLQPQKNTPEETIAFYREVASLIGLPFDTIRRYQARFDEFLYTTEFFAHDRKVLGGLDTRYVGDLTTVQRKNLSDDPSYNDMQGLHCAFNDYLHNALKTNNPFDRYIPFSSSAFLLWNYQTRDSIEWPELVQRVRRTLVLNPEMQVFVGSGYYDCRTPFAATEFCFSHLNLPSSYDRNFQFEYYEAGHGFIFDLHSLKKLHGDLGRFFHK